jgi:hypothetical protein
MPRYVVWQKYTDVSEDPAASIVRRNEFDNAVSVVRVKGFVSSDDGGSRII